MLKKLHNLEAAVEQPKAWVVGTLLIVCEKFIVLPNVKESSDFPQSMASPQ